MPPLTKQAIASLSAGAILRDEAMPGLHVRAGARRKSFYLYFRTREGVERRPKLGDCRVLTIPEARKMAREMLASVALGADPARDRGVDREAPDMGFLWQMCKKELWNNGTSAWDREVARLYDRHIDPQIGKVLVKNVKYSDVLAVHSALSATPYQANRAVAVLSKMLNHAERLELRPLGSNPCRHIERCRENGRGRYATPSEIARLGAIMEEKFGRYPREIAFLYLLLFSGARPSEIARATWDQLDGNVLRIENGKTGRRTVFLPGQAMAIIDRLPRDSRTITGLTGVPRRIWSEIRAAAGCPDLWARDFRRTFTTVGLSDGVSMGVLGEILGQKSEQTTKIYAKLIDETAKKTVSSIANRIEELITPGKSS